MVKLTRFAPWSYRGRYISRGLALRVKDFRMRCEILRRVQKMKKVLTLALSVLVAATMGLARTKGRTTDAEAIKKVFADFAAAWEKDDAKGMAAFWTEDGDLVNPAGRLGKGRAEVEKLLADEHAALFKGTRITFTTNGIRFIGRDVAIYDAAFEIVGAHGPDGGELPPQKGLVTSLLVKKGGQWRTVAARPMLPAPAPGAR